MSIFRSLLLSLFGAILLLSGCVTLYKPNAVHSPMVKEQGEGHVSASLGITGTGLGSVQAAVAVSDHIGIMADGMYHYRSSYYNTSSDTGTEKLNIFYGAAGLGYFEKFGKNNSQVIQVYGGGGVGKSEAKILGSENPEPTVSADFVDMFVQPGLLFSRQYVDIAVDVRAKYVRLYNINSYHYDQFDWWNSDFQYTKYTELEFMLFEPSFTLSAGGNNMRGLFQVGLTVPILNADAYFESSNFSPISAPLIKFNVGMSYSFGRKKSNKTTPLPVPN